MLQDILWVEKYRPKKIDEVILPENLKKTFSKFVEQKEIPNLMANSHQKFLKLDVPIKVDIGEGMNWDEAH